MTIWQPIKSFPEYDVSACGRVRLRSGECERTPQRHSCGYLQLRIKNKNLFLHRLVAEAFIPADPLRKQINHKNGNKHDNRVDNLERVTSGENHRHKVKVLGIGLGETHNQARLSVSDIVAIRSAIGTQQSIAKAFGICRGHVSDIRAGRRWAHIG
jgi:hypothetical protein